MRRIGYFGRYLMLALILGCVQSPVVERGPALPPNMAIYPYPIAQVWQHLLQVVHNDLLYNFELINQKERFFTTEWVQDEENSEQIVRYRLSATLKFEGKGVAVVLYRQIELRTDAGWQSVNSDYSTENYILQRLKTRLPN